MLEINEKFLNDTLRDYSRSTVGRLCKRIELLEEENLTEKQKLKILKEFQRELVYETFRDLKSNLKAHSNGLEYYKFKITNPLSTNNK